MNGTGTREPSAELGRYSKAAYANLARMGKYRKCQNEKEVIQKMKRILIAILIALMVFAQGVSADDGDANFTGGCPPVTILDVTIYNDSSPTPGTQITPEIPACHGVLKCSATPHTNCTWEGGSAMCQFNATGHDVGIATGTHCLDPSHDPVLCTFSAPDTGCDDQCEYDINGMWKGAGKGGWTYDPDDGYKMGLQLVKVNVTINSTGGVEHICKANGGVVKIWVDNYDSQNGDLQEILLMDPPECEDDELADTVNISSWIGYFFMHYWEKPGKYVVNAEVVSCCGETDRDKEIFNYQSSNKLCLAPSGKSIMYGSATMCVDKNSTAYGDVNTSTCEQCDIGSAPATIRNIGNTVINAYVHATHLMCQVPSCGSDRIPVSIAANGNGGFYKQGNIYINVGNGWNDLQTTPEQMNLTHQAYCIKEPICGNGICEWGEMQGCPYDCTCYPGPCSEQNLSVPGLPPGPHATNIMDLIINPLPCKSPGTYKQTITIVSNPIEQCCQDHRELEYPCDYPLDINWAGYTSKGVSVLGQAGNYDALGLCNVQKLSDDCITPSIPTPQCYEIPNRYSTKWGDTCED